VNNFSTSHTRSTNYWNFSDRADWNLNDQWRVYGRYSKLHTMVDASDPTPNKSPWYVTQGASARHALSISGDAVWTVNARTLVNFHGGYHSIVDDYDSPRDKLGSEGWGKIWPHSQWFKPYQQGLPPIGVKIRRPGDASREAWRVAACEVSSSADPGFSRWRSSARARPPEPLCAAPTASCGTATKRYGCSALYRNSYP
jgi:hypothetical protein